MNAITPRSYQFAGQNILRLQNLTSRIRTVRSVIYLFAILLLFILVGSLVLRSNEFSVEISVVILFLFAMARYVTGDTCNIVIGMTLWSVVILISTYAFNHDGLYDTTLYLYPCVLIFSSLMASRIVQVPLALYMLCSFYFLAYSSQIELIQIQVASPYSIWNKAHESAALLAIYGLGIFLVSSYVNNLLTRLADERAHNQQIMQESESRILRDQLTGLESAEKCKQDLHTLLNLAHLEGSIVAFIVLRLNNFNWINSYLGHKFGDEVLCKVSQRYQKLTSKEMRAYRTSGTEFVFICKAFDYEQIKEFCHRILRMTIMPFAISDYEFDMNCSLGISIAPIDGRNFHELSRKASFAVHRARRDEPNSFCFYEKEMEEAVGRRLLLMHELKLAIEQKQFEVFYQPKIDLKTNAIIGAEALIRWNKDGKHRPPAAFIPVAEESGLIVDIGRWVLESACRECMLWQQNGFGGLSVAVNLSPVQFKRGNLPYHVFRALQKSSLDPNLLELEITESLFIADAEHVKQQIHLISEHGVNFAIDDFGTGYSNLGYLSQFNASTLKIDMSFIRKMRENLQHRHIVNAIIKMSKVLDLDNVAEGVEDQETAALLIEQGCGYGQGYFWSKPLPANEFLTLLKLQNKAV